VTDQVQAPTIAKDGAAFSARLALQGIRGSSKAPARVKFHIVASKFRRLFHTLPGVIRLPFGSWWLVRGSALDETLMDGRFEPAETAFLRRYLESGMTILDVGAHHGYYSLLASRAVGLGGKIIAFEPSPRERLRLQEHLQLNNCTNVQVEAFALEAVEDEKELFLVNGAEDYCNSLRPPAVNAGTTTIKVNTTTLDRFLHRHNIDTVDFIKMDVEGAELNVLNGAKKLLTRKQRPVLLVELYDMRTAPWGYAAKEVVQLLAECGYLWYEIRLDGSLAFVKATHERFDDDANLVAIPPERERYVHEKVAAGRM